MPNTGDSFITTLKEAHLGWGIHRYTDTRERIDGEAYLQISSTHAYNLNITNSKSDERSPEYNFSTSDGFIQNEKLLASGNQGKEEFAKQFQGLGNLKLLGGWFNHINAQIGDQIRIDFISPTEILLTKI